MSAGLKTGCHDNIHARILQSDRLIRRGRRANRDNGLALGFLQNFLWRNASNEGEGRHSGVEQYASLILESQRLVG